jgi:hypothetical protein
MKSDTFWKYFWLATFVVVFVSVSASGVLFYRQISNANAAAVGIAFDPTKDPFEFAARQGHFALIDGALYRDALPLGLQQWNWDANLNWHSAEQVHSGTGALKATFLAQWAGLGLSGFTVNRSSYGSISIAVYSDSSVGDLYIELYDGNGVAQTRQSLGWYTPTGFLVPNQWQVVTIPLANLLGSTNSGTVTALSISTTNQGTAYLDDIQFTADATPHAPWVQPEWVATPPFNPFATSTPEALPYTLTFNANAFSHWYSYYGYFAMADTALKIGPIAPTYNDSLAVLRGGRSWSDYSINATVNWGITSTFSLLARMSDSQNYASCAYSYYGQTVQIYEVTNGVSTEMGQTPPLPVDNDAPWDGMKAGMQAKGDTVTCYANGEKVLSAQMPDLSSTGTVGFEAWDKNQYASPHQIVSYKVQPLLGE